LPWKKRRGTPLLRLAPQAVARTAQRPGLILAMGEEWGIFCGALPVLGRLGLGWLRKAWWWVGLDCRAARDSLATRVVLK
jgi:hypothetical protein